MINSDSSNSKDIDPKEELRRFIKKFQDMKNSKKESNPYNTLVSLRTYLDIIDVDSVTKDQLIRNMEYLRIQTRNTAIWRVDSKDIPENILHIIDEAYYELISLLEEIVQRSIPIKIKQKSVPVIKSSKSADLLRKILIKNHKQLPNDNLSKLSLDVEDSSEIEISEDDFQSIMKVFISHHIGKDLQLASSLRKNLREHYIDGIIAKREKEYELLIIEKIKQKIDSSDYLVAIITKDGLSSASVHEEIGFAIAKKIPVLLMVEKGVQEIGVLIHGKEPEYFRIDHFNEHVENIIRHILKNGARKKIFEGDKKQLREQVYEPCYNSMMNVYNDRQYLQNVPTNPWNNLTPALKLKTEPEIKSLFEEYSRELGKLQALCIERDDYIFHNKKKLMDILIPSFDKAGLLLVNGNIQVGKSLISFEGWFDMFQYVLFDPNIQDATMLYKKLLEFATTKIHWAEKSLTEWNDKTDLFRELVKVLPKLRESLNTAVSCDELMLQQQRLVPIIEKLTTTLEGKVTENI